MSDRGKVYISGPMTGKPENNKLAFDEVAAHFRNIGFVVVSPPELDAKESSYDWSSCLKRDLKEMLECDYIHMLDGWRKSRGAVLEKYVADEIGLIWIDKNGEETKESVLVEAESLINGDRQCQYGHPANDFVKTAKMWTGLLMGKLKDGVEISPEEIAMAMVLLKVSRHSHKQKRDNIVDMAGYSGTLEMLMEWRQDAIR